MSDVTENSIFPQLVSSSAAFNALSGMFSATKLHGGISQKKLNIINKKPMAFQNETVFFIISVVNRILHIFSFNEFVFNISITSIVCHFLCKSLVSNNYDTKSII